MNKNGEDQQVNTPNAIKFSNSFTEEIYKYIAIYKKSSKVPTLAGLAQRIGTDEKSIVAWATKKKKDEQGNITDEFARPNFYAAVKQLEEEQKIMQAIVDAKKDALNEKQELFCQLYATDREFFGNGVQSYIEAYDPDKSKPNWYNGAQASASRLLSNVIICRRINDLLSNEGLNDAFVDKQLLFVISQHDDKGSKVAAIREYNKLKKRITEKLDVTSDGKPILGGVSVSSNNSNK